MTNKKENSAISPDGKSLSEAIYAFGDHAKAEQAAKEIKKLPINKQFVTDPQQIDFWNKFNSHVHNSQKSSEYRYVLMQDLLNLLRRGTLIAFGYKIPRAVDDLLVQIPKDVWLTGKTDFYNSSVKGSGLEFVSIIISEKKDNIRISTNQNLLAGIKIENKPVGRPSIKPLIIQAYKFLEKEGAINCSKTFKSHIEAIQKIVRNLNPNIENNEGMEIESVRRAVSHLFKKHCAASKPTSKL